MARELLVLVLALNACSVKKPADTENLPLDNKYLFSVSSPKNLVTDIDRVEAISRAITPFVRVRVLDSIAERNMADLKPFLAEDFKGRWPDISLFQKVQTGTITIAKMTISGQVLPRAEFLAQAAKTFRSSAVMERRSWKIFDLRIDASKPTHVFVRGHLLLAGKTTSGHRYQLEATTRIKLEGNEKNWVLTAWDFEDATWSRIKKPSFRDISALTGFRFFDSQSTKNITQSLVDMRRLFTAGGLTVYDANQDGFWDILSTRKGRGARLFLNDGERGFQSQKIFPNHPDGEAANFYLALDINEDGRKDLISTHVVYSSAQRAALALYTQKNRAYAKNNKSFVFSVPEGLRELDYSSLISCDVNQDGRLDIIALGYKHADSGGAEFNLVDGKDGLGNLLFLSDERGGYHESSMTWGLHETQYSYVAECFDFDQDGDVDLFVGNDYGRNNYYENVEAKKFVVREAHPFAASQGFTMGFSMADIENTGDWSVALSNMYSHAGQRIVPFVSELGPRMQASVLALAGGNNLFQRSEDTWKDRAPTLGLNYAEWAWGNIFFDYDNDGDKDQYVVNGFTTHSDPSAPDF